MKPKTWLVACVILALAALGIMAFKPPIEKDRIAAIGSLDDREKKTYLPGDDFEPINPPSSGDWLDVHHEPGQTFDQYVKEGFVRPDKQRHTIYLLPIGKFEKDRSPSLDALEECARAYFMMKVKVLEPIPVEGYDFTTRINTYTKNRQVLTHDVLKLLKKLLPQDAFCILAVTMEDLYPDPSWNFVFGMASLYERVGVFSFARYDPAFYGEKRGKDYRQLLLRRSCKVLTHETGHMFGIQHCIYFQCGMCGSNHLAESDARPIHLCPVCLRKLQYNIGFDPVVRYRRLGKFYEKYGLEPEAKWVQGRLKNIAGK
jgi:archaemetzincin